MKSPLNKSQLLSQTIRVNHAGEHAALKIYAAQAKFFKNDPEFRSMLNHMKEQERHHLEYFTQALDTHKVKKTKLLPLWSTLSSLLGYSTAALGKKTAMACTVAVEEVISKHYQEQVEQLEESELKDKIKQFRAEELEHHDIGIENHAKKAKCYKTVSHIIKFGCKVAIALSKRI